MGTSQTSAVNRVSYGLGHGLVSAKNMLFHFFFLFYFVNVVGLPEWQVMGATVLAILIDAVSDPLMGQISDNTRSRRWGRRHGWILFSSLPTAAALALLFSPPDGMGETALFLWMAGFMIGTRVFITGYTVPYFALAADMSAVYDERTSIVGTRTIFDNIFNLLVFVLAFTVFLPDREGLEDGMLHEPGYAPLAVTLALVGLAGAGLMVLGTWNQKEATQPRDWSAGKPWHHAFISLAEAARFSEFRTLTLGFSLLVMLYSTISQLTLFVGTYVWRFDQTEKLVVSLVPFVVIIPAAIAAGWWSRRADKRDAALWLTWLFGLSFSLPFALYLLELTPPIGSTALLVLVAVTSGLGYAGMVGALILSYSMMADVSDLMTLETGRKREGLLFAAFTFANKLAFAGGLILATLGLTVIDLPDAALPSEVGDGTTRGLAVYSIATNAVLALAAWWAYHRYTLNRVRHAVLQEKLREARPVASKSP
ncbi:MAG: MFS transporter [Litorimonas sp.]